MPLPTWTPDLATLDLLLTVAQQGSLGRAAQVHGISQPSASARLARLERRLGVALFVRSPRGTSLTPAGEAVVAWAQSVVAAAAELADGVQGLRGNARSRLRVAASLTVAEYLLPAWLLRLRRGHAELDVSVAVANSHEVCAALRAERADVGFVETPAVAPDLSRALVGTDRLVLVAASSYPLAARAHVYARELADQPLLLREPGSGTRDTFLHALGRALGTTEPALPHATSLGSTATIVATVQAGGGIGVVSERAVAGQLAAGTMTAVPVPELDLTRPLHAVWRGRRATDLAAELIRIAAAG